MIQKGGLSDALDTFRNTVDSLVARVGEQLYDGWIHPHSFGNCVGRTCVPVDIRPADVDVTTGRTTSVGLLPRVRSRVRELRG
jgi:hypothetical protein